MKMLRSRRSVTLQESEPAAGIATLGRHSVGFLHRSAKAEGKNGA